MTNPVAAYFSLLELVPMDPADVPSGSFFLDSTNSNAPSVKSVGGTPSALGTTSGVVPNNPTNNSFVSSGGPPESPGADAANDQSATGTFSTACILFTVTFANGSAMLCMTSYASTKITAVTDQSGYFIPTDSGVGLYMTKSPNSYTVTFTSRLGTTQAILIQAVQSNITSATPWA